MPKYGVFSGTYFPVFGLKTEIFSVNLRIQSEYKKIRTRKNSVFGHFSRSANVGLFVIIVNDGKLLIIFAKSSRYLTGFLIRLLITTHCAKNVQIRSFFQSVFSRIWTEYGDLRYKSPYSVQMRKNTDQTKLRIWILFTQ